MTGLSWIDFTLRLIPEALIIIFAGYAVSKKDINIKLYLLSCIVLAGITFGLKNLPISAALPIVLSAITAVFLLVFINKIKIVHSIISTIACLIITVLIEGITMYVLDKFLHVDTYAIFTHASPLLRILYGSPSLLLFAVIVITYYLISRRVKAKSDEPIQ